MNREEFEKLLKKQESERTHCKDKILNSDATRKVIVSGPGTGKTHIFKELLSLKDGNCLALTFINNLADKLKKDLNDYAKACTFHSFCKGLLHKINIEGINDKFVFFPNLDLIVRSDAQIIHDKNPNFKRSFARLDNKTGNIRFFIERSNFYNAVSFDDSVFRVLEYLKNNPSEIPNFTQIVVDEYQDFNKLEVDFIDILETKSPILIVGDDDQALYTSLKYASPKYIRAKYKDPKYAKFPLPFSNRCPKIIIDAMNDVISQAKAVNRLKDRVDKKFTCYLPKKLSDSKKYPNLIHAHCTVQSKRTPYIAKFIEKEIDELTYAEIEEANSEGDYTALITGPKRYIKQINSYLESRKKYCLHHRELEPESRKIRIIDGYKILLEDKFSNLGWRILIECEHDIDKRTALLKRTVSNGKKQIYDYLPDNFIKRHEKYLSILKRLKEDSAITEQQKEGLEAFLKTKIKDLNIELEKTKEIGIADGIEASSSNSVSIILATYVGCKGISAGYVFVVGLNEGNLPKDNRNPSDIEIAKFVVALTRTIKKCYLISVTRFAGQSEGKRSVFLDWIDSKRIKYEKIDAHHWQT